MLKIEKFVTMSPEQWEIVIEGMRNPKNSWDKSDSYAHSASGPTAEQSEDYNKLIGCIYDYEIGDADHSLMMSLAKGGPVHAKYRRMIPVWVTINAPLYWFKEFDTYKVGTVANSCSTMHKIHAKEFTEDDFSMEHLIGFDDYDIPNGLRDVIGTKCHFRYYMLDTIHALNNARDLFLATNDKKYWHQMIQLLPSSYNQKRTVMLNYEVLNNIYHSRKNHKLDEWHVFCDWIRELPYSELIIGEEGENGGI